MGRVFCRLCEFVCLSVHALKGKRLEPSSLKSVETRDMSIVNGMSFASTSPGVKRSKDLLEIGT